MISFLALDRMPIQSLSLPCALHSLLCIHFEVISRSTSCTLIASDTAALASSGAPRCTLKACPRRHDDRRVAVGRAPDCATHARARFHSRGLGFLRPAPP
jgi:hypothetical protein